MVAPEPAADARVTETSVSVSVPSTGAAIDRSALSPRVLADLFWLGRYGERTEATVRMVRVVSERHLAQRFRPRADDTAVVTRYLAGVAAATGTTHLLEDDAPDVTAVVTAMTAARTVPGTVAHALDRLSSSARAVRDQMSTSTWMVLGTVERAMADLRSRTPGDLRSGASAAAEDLAAAHERMLHGMLALSGLQADSMVHDPGWVFMDAGRRLERIIAVCELLRGIAVERCDPVVEQALLEAFLVANESAVIYRRRNRGMFRLRSVIMLSVLDETNPRSVIHQLDALHDDWDRLPDEVRSAAVERTVSDLVADVRRVEVGDLVAADDTGTRVALDRSWPACRTAPGPCRTFSDARASRRRATFNPCGAAPARRSRDPRRPHGHGRRDRQSYVTPSPTGPPTPTTTSSARRSGGVTCCRGTCRANGCWRPRSRSTPNRPTGRPAPTSSATPTPTSTCGHRIGVWR